MNRHLSLVTLCLLLFSAAAQAQSSSVDRVTVGPGFGFDYGGIGLNVTAWPQKNIGLFVGLGDAQSYIDNLRNNYGVNFNNNLPPIGFSLGYKIVLN